MRSVSDNYLAMGYESYEFFSDLKITVERTTGEFTSAAILGGSFSISNKCINNSTMEFGAVYQGECIFTLVDLTVDVKANDIITVYQVTDDDEIEMGTFQIHSATTSDYLTYCTCYDFMDYFNTAIDATMSGTLYAMCTAICEKCGVEFGHTEEELEAFPNAEYGIGCTISDGTYRDVLSQIARALGRFAVIVNGKLRFDDYKQEVARQIPKEKVMGLEVESYVTEYKEVTARFLATENYYPYTYTDKTKSVGLSTDLGDLSIYTMDSDLKDSVLSNIYENYLVDVAYQPTKFKITFPDASIELGDLIEVEGKDGTMYKHYVMSYTFTNRDVIELVCYGDNPSVAESSSSQIEATVSTLTDSSGVSILNYQNADAIDGSSSIYKIAEWTVVQTSSSLASIDLTLPIKVLASMTLEISMYKNATLISEPYLVDLDAGNRLVACNNHVLVEAYESADIEIYISCDTLNSFTINALQARSTLITSAIATGTDEEWNGLIEITDTVPLLSKGGLTVSDITDNVSASVQYPRKSTITEILPSLSLGGLTIG